MSSVPATPDPDALVREKLATGEFQHAGEREHAEHGEHHGFAHISPISTLVAVFVALIALTVITWAVAKVEVGDAELLVAMVIATIKAGLVCTWFMHLRYDKPLNTLLFVFSTFFLALFLVLTISDANQYAEQLDTAEYPEVTVEDETDSVAEPSQGGNLEGRP